MSPAEDSDRRDGRSPSNRSDDAGALPTQPAAWEDNIAALHAGLNFEDEFTAAGTDWVEALPDGTVVRRSATTQKPTTVRRRSAR